jgi:tetratricopeptide (TPR) repeat protein
MRSRCSSSFLAIAFVAGCGWSGLALAEEDPEPLTPARYLELKLDADAAWEQEDLEAAVPLYEKLLAVNPRDGEIRRRLALALREPGRTDSAVPLARRALETGFANEARMSLRLARVSAMAGEPEKALRWIRRALDAGLENRPQLKQDEAFASLRDDPRFRELAGFRLA